MGTSINTYPSYPPRTGQRWPQTTTEKFPTVDNTLKFKRVEESVENQRLKESVINLRLKESVENPERIS